MNPPRILAPLTAVALGAGLLAVVACSGSSSGRGASRGPTLQKALWGQFRGNDRNQARGGGLGSASGLAGWSTDLGSSVVAAVTVDGAGNLRARTSAGEVVALRRDGTILWRSPVGPGDSTPVLDSRGACYVGGTDGTVVKLDIDGQRRWSLSLGGDPGTGLLYASERILFAGTDGQMRFLRADGTVLATLGVGAVASSVAVSTNNNQLFVASTDGNLYEIQLAPTDGTPAVGVSLGLPGSVSACTPVSAGSAVYVVTDQDVLVKAYKDRFNSQTPTLLWSYDPKTGSSSGGRSSPALGRDGTVYYGTSDGRLLALDPNGNLLWSHATGQAIHSSPVLDGQDNLFFRTVDGTLHSLSKQGQVRFRRPRNDVGGTTLDPTATLDPSGRLYLGTHGGHVLGIGGGPVYGQVGGDGRHHHRFADDGPRTPDLDWMRDLGTGLRRSPLVFEDGTLALLGMDGLLYGWAPQGLARTTTAVGGFVDRIALGSGNVIHATTTQGEVQGFQRSGVQLYSTSLVTVGTLTAPAVAADGSLRIGSSSGRLFCLDPGGTRLWSVIGVPMADNVPAVRPDGTTVVADTQGRLQEFDSSGRPSGSYPLPGPVRWSSPVLADDGTTYVLTDQDVLVAVGADGLGRWLFDPQEGFPGGGKGGPSLVGDTLVFVTAAGTLYGRDAVGGAPRFQFDLGAPAASPPVSDVQGRVFVVTADGGFHQTDAAGTTPWSLDPVPGAVVSHGPVLAGDGGVLLGTDTGRLLRVAEGRHWPTFHGGPEHSGQRLASLALTGVVDWSIPLGGTPELSPLIDDQGNVFLHTLEGELLIVDAAGNIQQRLAAGSGPGLPLFVSSGRYFTGSAAGVITAFSRAGQSLWFQVLPGSISGLTVDRFETLLFGSAGQLNAWDLDGNQLWSAPAGPMGEGAVAVGADGNRYLAGADGVLYAFDAAGTARWTANLPGPVSRSTPTVAADGTVYVTTDADVLVAVTADGQVPWSVDPVTGSNLGGRSAPALDRAGLILWGAMDGLLRAARPDGSLAWSYDAGSPIRSAPVVEGQDNVFFGAEDGALYAVQPGGTLDFRLDLSGGVPGPLTSPALGADGALHVASSAGNLFRIL